MCINKNGQKIATIYNFTKVLIESDELMLINIFKPDLVLSYF